MSPELDKKLCEKYPEIFRGRNGDMRQTCMVWGFEHGDGWYPIIDVLCKNIMWHCTENLHLKPNGEPLTIPVAVQVKEKFGTLRFYVTACDDIVHAYITMAESMSARTCEECGATATAKVRGSGWLMCRCDNCVEPASK